MSEERALPRRANSTSLERSRGEAPRLAGARVTVTDATAPFVEMRGIVKRFGDFTALHGVDLVVDKHEIHALLGENGAGKSTLMNILYGLYRPDAGTITLQGQDASIRSPRDAIARGIGMIHQHFMLIPPLTVAENVVLGDERSGPVLSQRQLATRVRELAKVTTGIAPEKDVLARHPEVVRLAHSLNLTVTCWTFRADEKTKYPSVRDEMQHFLYDLGIDALFTNNPDQFPRR